MFVPCILAGTHVHTWFKSMRTLFRRLTKKKSSGQATKVLTARQRWMVANFQFLSAHLTIRTPHSQLGRVPIPATVSVAEGDDNEDDAISVSSSQVPSQVATSSQAASQQPQDTRSPRATSGVRRVDDAILSLVQHMTETSAIQDHLQTAEQEASRPRIAFCQWMGLEMAKLDELLWNGFMAEAFTRYKWAQSQQLTAAPPHPPPVPQPPMQPQPQLAPVWPYSAPPQPSPSCRHQQNQLGSLPPAPAPTSSIPDGHPLPPTHQPSTPAASRPTSTPHHCPCTCKQHAQHAGWTEAW